MSTVIMEKPKDMRNFSAEEMADFLNSFDTIMSDCDGVLWHLYTPVSGALDTLKTLQSFGKRVLFVSNNSTIFVEDYVKKFKKMGFEATPDQIVIPSLVILAYLRKIKFEGKALVIGTTSFRKFFENAGIDVITAPTSVPESLDALPDIVKLDPDVKAVIFDFDINLSWAKIFQASLYLARKNVIYLTGALDKNLLVAKDLLLLGIDQFSDILIERSGKKPIECAKPSEQLENYLFENYQISDATRCIFVGDSLLADMKFAKSCGFKSIWVGSGVDTPESCEAQKTVPMADYYLSDLGVLNELIKTSRANRNDQPFTN
uniref:Pho2_3 protein n=1 Tax=Fopius arisanus TaxID=64838 RepID=A0A0C9RA54_9HYME